MDAILSWVKKHGATIGLLLTLGASLLTEVGSKNDMEEMIHEEVTKALAEHNPK